MAPNRRQANAEATRQALLSAARELFSETGYEATGIDEIAARAGATRGAVYHHFAGKRDLMLHVLDQIQADLADRVTAVAATVVDPVERTTTSIDAYLDAATEPGTARILLDEAPAALGWDTWREVDEHHFLGLIKAGIVDMQRDGRLSESDPEALADLLMGALTQAARLLARDRSASGRLRVDDALDALLHGVIS